MNRSRRPVPIRFALLALVAGLVVLTVLAISLVSAVTSAQSVADLQRRYFHATSQAAAARVRSFLEPALDALADVRDQAAQGRVDLADSDDLGRYLLARLRNLPTLAWLSHSAQATGRFTGVWRREDGALVLNVSDPSVDGGMPTERVLREDGQLEPLHRELKGGYDPRQADWYRRAAAAPGAIWTEPFEFNEGRLGITAALALRLGPGAPVTGVLTADFFLDGLGAFLQQVASESTTSIDVLSRSGRIVASSWCCGDPGAADAALREALAGAPARVAEIDLTTAVSWVFPRGRERRIGGMSAFATSRVGEWVVLLSVPEDRFLAAVHGNRRTALFLGAAVLLLAVALGWLLATRIARPLRRVADDLERVARFDLASGEIPGSRVKEIHVVRDAAERMKASLRSFGRYVPAEVVRDLLARGEEARLGGHRREITVVFSDVAGFTSIGEGMEPQALVEHLGEYFEAVCGVIHDADGTVDKFMGDGILAFFNAPRDVPRHAERACRAALESRVRVEALAPSWRARGRHVLRTRLGIHTGLALVGNVGTRDRFGYTAMGDAVNLASRLEGLNKRYGTSILASEATLEAAGDGFEWRRLDRVAVAGRKGGTLVAELLGLRGAVPPPVLAARDAYERGLEAFLARRFAEAAAAFAQAERTRPGDEATSLQRARAEGFQAAPPPPDWDGTAVLTEK